MQATSYRSHLRAEAYQDRFLLYFETERDRPGVLFRIAAVLFANDWNIEQASIHTSGSLIRDEFLLSGQRSGQSLSQLVLEQMRAELETLLSDDLSVIDYLTIKNRDLPTGSFTSGGVEWVQVPGPGIALTGRDKPGLLTVVAAVFHVVDLNILEAKISSRESGEVRNIFYFDPADVRTRDSNFCLRLVHLLQRI
ncbi:MAG: hypothetical protein HS115_19670 [Spirochaetales bacterium]|nr:hypothetical protein [Spirochaetales bacterium]